MCGIYGFAGFKEDGLIDRMGRVIRHRGPDGQGRYAAPDGIPFEMGMQRLSIIDLEGGWQPVYNEDQNPGRVLQRRDLQLPRTARGTASQRARFQDA